MMIQIIKLGSQGIVLPQLNIAFDGNGRKGDHLFISHAHSDHMPRNRKAPVYCTANTGRLMKKRGHRGKITPVSFGKPMQLPAATVTLYPAGHILGSAMVYVETDEGSLLYSGDYRTPPSLATEGFKCPPKVDQFITEATYSLPIYKWDSSEALTNEIQQFATRSLHDGCTPVFLAYNLGKAQEIMHMLAPLKHPVQIHPGGYPLCQIYEQAGIDLGNYQPYNAQTATGKIIIAPGRVLKNGFAANITSKRLAWCSGWAVSHANWGPSTADQRIPLSDHSDFFELIDICNKLHPKIVHITHTPNAKVVQYYLSNLNIKSSYLS